MGELRAAAAAVVVVVVIGRPCRWHIIIPHSTHSYTSIGDYATTVPNPALLTESGDYLPAYELQEYSLERSNRNAGSNGGTSSSSGPSVDTTLYKGKRQE